DALAAGLLERDRLAPERPAVRVPSGVRRHSSAEELGNRPAENLLGDRRAEHDDIPPACVRAAQVRVRRPDGPRGLRPDEAEALRLRPRLLPETAALDRAADRLAQPREVVLQDVV